MRGDGRPSLNRSNALGYAIPLYLKEGLMVAPECLNDPAAGALLLYSERKMWQIRRDILSNRSGLKLMRFLEERAVAIDEWLDHTDALVQMFKGDDKILQSCVVSQGVYGHGEMISPWKQQDSERMC